MRAPKSFLVLLASIILVFAPYKKAEALNKNQAKAFMLTSTYGVMAGTLTGLATLAFYPDPGDHLRNVALGASLGLYMGVALGAYLVYFAGPPPAQPGDPEATPGESEDPLKLKDKEGEDKPRLQEGSIATQKNLSVAMLPQLIPIVSVDLEGRFLLGMSYKF